MSAPLVALIGYGGLLLAGESLTRLIVGRRCAPGLAERIPLALAFGAGAVSLFLFWASLLAPGAVGVGAVLLPLAALALAGLWRRPPGPVGRWRVGFWAVVVALVCALAIGNTVAVALATDLGWDGLLHWGLKARMAFLNGGIPLSYFEDDSRLWSHLNYPWLLPLTELWLHLLSGQVAIAPIKPLFPMFYGGLLLFLYAGVRAWHSSPVALVFVLLLAIVPELNDFNYLGYADVPLATFWLGSVVYLHRWMRGRDRRDLLFAAALVALAAWTKREGTVFWLVQFAAVVVTLAAGRRTRGAAMDLAAFLAVSAVVMVPWSLFQRYVGAPDVIFAPLSPATALANLDRLPAILSATQRELANQQNWGLLWYLFALGILALALPGDRWRRAYLAATVVLPVLAIWVGYLHTLWVPYTWHVDYSITRIVLQQAPGATFFVAMTFAPALDRLFDRVSGARPARTPAVA